MAVAVCCMPCMHFALTAGQGKVNSMIDELVTYFYDENSSEKRGRRELLKKEEQQ